MPDVLPGADERTLCFTVALLDVPFRARKLMFPQSSSPVYSRHDNSQHSDSLYTAYSVNIPHPQLITSTFIIAITETFPIALPERWEFAMEHIRFEYVNYKRRTHHIDEVDELSQKHTERVTAVKVWVHPRGVCCDCAQLLHEKRYIRLEKEVEKQMNDRAAGKESEEDLIEEEFVEEEDVVISHSGAYGLPVDYSKLMPAEGPPESQWTPLQREIVEGWREWRKEMDTEPEDPVDALLRELEHSDDPGFYSDILD